MELNRQKRPCVIISASGMCEGGRVVHHIKHSCSDERNTILLMGYQSPGTLGWQIAQHRPYLKIFDRDFPLRAHVEQLDGLSAHADAPEFKWWLEESTRAGHFGQAFLVHGEPDALQGMADLLKDYCDEPAVIPRRGQTIKVE
jgi:metallo-beta-lactamase family protein